MALPELIEIAPLNGSVHAVVTIPGSKSITNRAMVLAALGGGETRLAGALWSEDTQVMAACLQKLGFPVEITVDPGERSNRTIRIGGRCGAIPGAGTAEEPLDLWVGNAGTAARFLGALVCLGRGVYRLRGVSRMHERPQKALLDALRQLGYRIDSGNDHLPATFYGGGPRPNRECTVSIEESSQFASALLLGGQRGGWRIQVTGENAEESPYVAMTSDLIKSFPHAGGVFQVEPDASSGSYFWAAGWLAPAGSSIVVANWPDSGQQIDAQFPKYLHFPQVISRQSDLGDSIMTSIVLAALAPHPVVFTDLGRLRAQECERVAALRTELAKCGARVREEGDSLQIHPSALHGAEIDTYHDHRMAMCFATLGLKVPGIRLKNPACVKKTFPDFFQKLAAAPPRGLGAVLTNPATGRTLRDDELASE